MSRVLPILFNTDAVRAILDGRKTVTRRSIPIDIANRFDIENDGKTVVSFINQETGDRYKPTDVSRYQKDDILYVRETWNTNPLHEYGNEKEKYVYKSTYDGHAGEFGWHPSIHMPREAARIWLKVTDVRTERLHDITQIDIWNEGINTCDNCQTKDLCLGLSNARICYLKSDFIELWDSTVKKPDLQRYGWDANPWVWVIEFERCEKPEPCVIAGIESAEDKRPCIGYGKSDIDDEPCEMCKSCGSYSGQEE